MKDTELTKYLGLPNTTSRDWKKADKDNWRYRIYHFIKQQPKENIEHFLKLNNLEILEK
jgi:hypothetical protein